MSQKGMKRAKREQELSNEPSCGWNIKEEDIGNFVMDEHVAISTMASEPLPVSKEIDEIVMIMQARILKRFDFLSDKYISTLSKKVLRKSGGEIDKLIPVGIQSKVIDKIAIDYYTEFVSEQGIKVLIIPMMQLLARSPIIIHRVMNHPNYEIDEKDPEERLRRNTFISSIICEKFNTVLFEVVDESDFTPSLVVIICDENTDPNIFTHKNSYPSKHWDINAKKLVRKIMTG